MEIDYEEELKFIAEETGFDIEVIEAILDADIRFLESKGIAVVDSEEE